MHEDGDTIYRNASVMDFPVSWKYSFICNLICDVLFCTQTLSNKQGFTGYDDGSCHLCCRVWTYDRRSPGFKTNGRGSSGAHFYFSHTPLKNSVMNRKIDTKLITLVIPVFNEEENIKLIEETIFKILSPKISYEIVFIDDGSIDSSLDTIKQIANKKDNVYFISFSRNFGHQNALKAAFDRCRGDIIISLDCDLQHPPELIPDMLELWQHGFDIVYTCRKDTRDTSAFKRSSATLFYSIINLISKLNLKSGVADFRLIDKKVLDSLRLYNEYDLFFRGLVANIGFNQTEITYTAGKRAHGKSKYSIRKMISLAVSGITGFSVFPLRILTALGLLFSFFSLVYGFYAVGIRFFTNQAVPGWASIMAGIYFLGGLQLAALGICGEYIGKTFLEVKRRPHYIIAESKLPSDSPTD